MYRFRRRTISQATRQILQDIHRENDRQRQIDRGLVCKHFTPATARNGETVPLYVGPTIEAVRDGDEWAA